MNKENAYTQMYTEGKKYQDNKNLTTTEIAKLVRKEVRAKYPKKQGYSISVTCDYFSMGSSIDISIKDVPFQAFNEEYAKYYIAKDWNSISEQFTNPQKRSHEPNTNGSINHWDFYNKQIRTPEMDALTDDLKHIVEQYNFSDCDGMIDYFHVNYWADVSIHWEYKDMLVEKSIGAIVSIV